MVVEDATGDARFAASPLVAGHPQVRFYAGAALTTADGLNLGALCVMDDKPRRRPSDAELERLRTLAHIVVDEMELRRAHRRAEEKQRQLELAEHMAAMGHWRFDLVSGVLSWSDEVYRIHGVDRLSFTPTVETVLPFYGPEDQFKIIGAVERTMAGEAGFEFELGVRRPDGAWRDVACKGMSEFNASGEPTGLIGVFQDITGRKVQERALATSEARYRLIADHASDVIMQSDLRGRIAYASPSVAAFTGHSPEELVGRRCLEFIHPDDHAAVEGAVAAQLAGQAASRHVEYRVLSKDGREVWVEATPTIALDPVTGERCGITDVIRDVTARKALEQELRAARAEAETAAAVKAEFLANMSHELRTPLTSIIGFAGLIAAQPELSGVSRGFVDRVTDASRALLSTVNDVLDFSKLEAGQVSIEPQPVDVAKLCRTTLDLFTPQAGAKDLALEFRCDAAPGLTVELDPDRIRQVLLNLVGNAVKFSAAGGVTLSVGHDGERLRVDVADTGPGMSPEQQAKLFQRFADVDGSLTRTSGGTGLGLAICKGLVEAMGGAIGVSSRRGVGSRFWFEVPAPVSQQAASAGVVARVGAMPVPGLRVLVVDDHATNRELVRMFLSGVGVEVSDAAGGAEAIEAANTAPLDVILMDLNMPGMSGTAACEAIRRGGGLNAAIPILAFTATAEEDMDMVDLGAAGFDGIVTKPVHPAALIAAIVRATDYAAAQTDSPDALRRTA
jgi:PAS domain S-box-containing protein